MDMHALHRPRIWVATILVIVAVTHVAVLLVLASAVGDLREDNARSTAAAERRAVEAQEFGEERLTEAMTCLTGLLLIHPTERTDDRVTQVCPNGLLDEVRDRLAP